MSRHRTFQRSVAVKALAALLLLLFVGCSQSPETLHQAALEASRDATAAAEEQDAKRAMAASRRATKLLRKLEKQAESNEVAQRLVGEVRLAVMDAQERAELVDEQRQLHESLTGLKARAYRASRDIALQGLLSAAALGADQMALHGTNILGDNFELQSIAMELTDLSMGLYDGDFSGMTNWTNVAATLRIWATNPPPETALFLALAFAGTGQADLAVTELDMVGTNVLASPNKAMLVHGTRAMVCVAQGWNRLAAVEVEQLAALAPESDYDIKSEDAVIFLRVLMVGDAVHQQDWQKLDELVADCIKIAPNHPMVVYLTGERLAANGDWENAAESMEIQARSAEEKWVAEKLSGRAREIRDGRGNQNRFADSKLFLGMAVFLLNRHAKNSEAARSLEMIWEQAGRFGKRWFGGEPAP